MYKYNLKAHIQNINILKKFVNPYLNSERGQIKPSYL